MTESVLREETINFCQQLIKAKSLSGQESDVANLIKKKMLELGYDDAWIDVNGSVIGKIVGQGTKKILFDGHIDTVPVTEIEKWTYAPYEAIIQENCIYGRGASDMKGAIAAMVVGLSTLINLKEELDGTIYVSGTVFEELYEGAALKNIIDEIKPDYVVIGEASELNVQRGQRGRAEIKLTTFGIPAHSANPQHGINALKSMVKLLPYIEDLKLAYNDFLGPAIIEPTDIISYPYPGASVVPDKCEVTFDRRLLLDEKPETVLEEINTIILDMKKKDESFSAQVVIAKEENECYTGKKINVIKFAPAWEIPEEHLLVQTAVSALNEIGQNPGIGKYSFCTNGSYSAGVVGIPTIGYGPSRENQAHVIDEYIEIETLIKAAEGFRAIAKGILKNNI